MHGSTSAGRERYSSQTAALDTGVNATKSEGNAAIRLARYIADVPEPRSSIDLSGHLSQLQTRVEALQQSTEACH